ncbi:UNVERIFIED_CONTAM: hypothetical protein NCL1_36998 [Trichonephila clavipes]
MKHIVDPFHYENVLTTDALDAINKRLDLVYFQRKNNFNPEVTPEMDFLFRTHRCSIASLISGLQNPTKTLKALKREIALRTPKEKKFAYTKDGKHTAN